MTKALTKQRNIEFIGDHKNNSIVIGNYGDAKLIAKGNFDLSGMIYCIKNTIEFNLTGDGVVSFSGICKKLMIRGIEGNIILDLNNLSSDVVWCESVKGKSTVILGPSKVIELISLDNDAVVRYDGKTILMNYSIRGNSKIEVSMNKPTGSEPGNRQSSEVLR